MNNLQKAKKAFEKACCMEFLNGRKCSFVDGRYHEDYEGGEIEIYVYSEEGYNTVSIRGTKSFGGWYDVILNYLTSSMTATDIAEMILDMLDGFRKWVEESESKTIKEVKVIRIKN